MDYKDVIIVVMAIVIVIIVALIIYLIYTSVSTSTKFIDPRKCPSSSAEFGVTPGVAGNKIVNSCGDNKTSPCTFTNIGSLSEAINKCHQFSNICTSFSYTPGIMNIISPTDGVSSSSTYDTYVQQIIVHSIS